MEGSVCRPDFAAEPVQIYQNEYRSDEDVTHVTGDILIGKSDCCCFIEGSGILQEHEVSFNITPISESFVEYNSSEETLLDSDFSFKEQEQALASIGSNKTLKQLPDEGNIINGRTEIDIDDIQLYLECSDDNFTINQHELDTKWKTVNGAVAEATSQIKMDTQFKISFPVVPEKMPNCGLCKKVFLSKDFLREHSLTAHPDVFKFCTFCPYFTKSSKFFQTHLNSRHSLAAPSSGTGGDVSSEDVRITFTLVESVTDTCWSHDHGILSDAVTSETNESLSGRSQVRSSEHRRSSSAGRYKECVDIKVQCDLCQFVTKTKRLLNYHKKTMHNDHRNVLKCSQCAYMCKQKTSMDAHLKKHAGILDFGCEVCGKKYASRHLLTKHARVHVRGNPEINMIHTRAGVSSKSTQTKIARKKKIKGKK